MVNSNNNNYLGFKVEYGYDADEDMILAIVKELGAVVSGVNYEHAFYNVMEFINNHVDTKF